MKRSAPDTAHSRSPRKVAHLSPRARRVRHELVVWAVEHGHSVCFDSLTVLLATKDSAGEDITVWTEDDVWHLWWVDILHWCQLRAVSPPDDLAATFAALFTFLDAVDGFGPGSDSMSELLGALSATGASRPKRRSQQPAR